MTAARPEENPRLHGGVGLERCSIAGDLPSITLEGLDRASASELLTSTDVSLAPSVLRQVLDTSAGNPLALWLAHRDEAVA